MLAWRRLSSWLRADVGLMDILPGDLLGYIISRCDFDSRLQLSTCGHAMRGHVFKAAAADVHFHPIEVLLWDAGPLLSTFKRRPLQNPIEQLFILQRTPTQIVDERSFLSADFDISNADEHLSWMGKFTLQCLERASRTPDDAASVFGLVCFLHANNTKYFSTLRFFDTMIRALQYPVFLDSSSLQPLPSSVANCGELLRRLLGLLLRWKSPTVYASECASRVGFCVSFSDPQSRKATHEDYVKVVFKWYCKVLKGMMEMLDSSDPIDGLHLLIAVGTDVFPVMRKLDQHLCRRLEPLSSHATDGEVRSLAATYLAQLEAARGSMQTQDEFCMGIHIGTFSGVIGPPAP